MIDTRLLLLTDRSLLPAGRELVDTLAACAAAGATHVVVREHDLPAAERSALISTIATLPLTVISSHTVEPSATLVHLAADQPIPAGVAHARSCHSARAVAQAASEGAAYVTLSPFAPTITKPGYGPTVDPADYAGDPGVPVFALGGIGAHNAGEAIAAGAHGIAVMGEVMRSADPGQVVRHLLEAVA